MQWYGPCVYLTQLNTNNTRHVHNLLTYSTVQSPSWEANWIAASQEIPPISRNPKVHYRTHKRPPPVSILGQPNPVHTPTFHYLKINLNIILPSTPRSPKWSFPLKLPVAWKYSLNSLRFWRWIFCLLLSLKEYNVWDKISRIIWGNYDHLF